MKESRKHSILHQIIPLFYRKKNVAKNLSIMSIEETVYIETGRERASMGGKREHRSRM